MKDITTDVSSFETMRSVNALYVDKTAFVWRLVSGASRTFFMSRPRRFGKSLLLSTFKAFFQGRRDLFEGLAIERMAPEKWDVFPVLSISMTVCAGESITAPEILRTLINWVNSNAKERSVEIEGDTLAERFSSLIVKLKEKLQRPVVVLVDEYDRPILDHLMMDDVHQILDAMKQFYQVIKDCNEHERFVFLTGVTKFAHTSLFSGINNPTDLTWRNDFATMLGYTEEELKANFAEHIVKTACAVGMGEEAMLSKMKVQYDGFRFGDDAPTVYNPVSVGKFFAGGGKFLTYWADTGTPSFFVKAARQTPMSIIEESRNTYVSQLSFDKYEVDKLDPFVFAVQCGYLTLQDTTTEDDEILYRFDFPNKEIRTTFSRFLLGAHIDKRESEADTLVRELKTMLKAGDVEGFLKRLKHVIAGMAWGNLGDDGGDPVRFYEGYFRNVLTFMMTLFRVDNEVETRSANGQVDLVCCANGHRYVFELKAGEVTQKTTRKTAKPISGKPTKVQERKIAKLLDAAIAQARDKGYYEKYLVFPQDIQLVALAFDTTTRSLAGWRVERIK